jgi:hypothetical protein
MRCAGAVTVDEDEDEDEDEEDEDEEDVVGVLGSTKAVEAVVVGVEGSGRVTRSMASRLDFAFFVGVAGEIARGASWE